nr:MAG TPA: hypothetical protein [Caudoviricetes sp.]
MLNRLTFDFVPNGIDLTIKGGFNRNYTYSTGVTKWGYF